MRIGTAKKNLYFKFLSKARNLFYFAVIQKALYLSRLGRRSMLGYADSGANFEYIYMDKPKGYNFFGKLVDWFLLNLPSAKATRARKNMFCQLLSKEIDKNKENNKKTKIVDLACGVSRYTLEAINEEHCNFVEAVALEAAVDV